MHLEKEVEYILGELVDYSYNKKQHCTFKSISVSLSINER